MFEPLSAEEWDAMMLTLRVAGIATIWTLPVAIVLAWILARTRWTGRDILSGIVHLPLVLPPVVTGYLLLVWMGKRGAVGALIYELSGFSFSFRWTGAALASAVMSLPLMVRPIRQSFESIDQGLESAAATLGARPVVVFLTVTLPLAIPGILAAIIIGFAKAVGEFGATATFVGNIPGETRTLALAIYTLSQVPGEDLATLRLVIISIILAFLAIGLSEWLQRRLARHFGGADAER